MRRTLDNLPPEKAAQVRELLTTSTCSTRGPTSASDEGVDGRFDRFADLLERPAPGQEHPGHGRANGPARGAEVIRPVASMWDAMLARGFAIGTNPRVQVSPPASCGPP